MANPLLALSVQPSSVDVAGSFAKGQDIQTASLGNMLRAYQLKKLAREEQEAGALQELVKEIGPGLVRGEDDAINRLAQISPDAASGYREKATKGQADNLKIAIDRAEFVGRSANGILTAPPEARPLLYRRALAQAEQMGMDVSNAPQDYDENTIRGMMAQAMSVKDQLKQHLDEQEFGYRQKNDAANRAVTVRGQNMVDARARESNAANVWRDLTPAEKKAKGLPADSTYQINAKTGKVERVAGNTSVRPIPSAALSGIQSNRRTLEKIDKALAELDANPAAVGWGNYAPEAITQRIPGNAGAGGVTTRAIIADIGSQKIHDRSGAAVTASETPRLKPFIPAVTDTPEAVRQKLQNLRAEYQASVDEAEAFYSPEAGYTNLPGRGAGAKPGNSGGKSVNAGVIDFNDYQEQ